MDGSKTKTGIIETVETAEDTVMDEPEVGVANGAEDTAMMANEPEDTAAVADQALIQVQQVVVQGHTGRAQGREKKPCHCEEFSGRGGCGYFYRGTYYSVQPY